MGVLDRFRLDGRVCLITGASRGLGRAMAGALSEAGAQIAAVSRDPQQIEAVAAELAAASGRASRGYDCDITDAAQVTGQVEPD